MCNSEGRARVVAVREASEADDVDALGEVLVAGLPRHAPGHLARAVAPEPRAFLK